MSLRTLFRRSAVPVVAAVALGALAAAPAEAAIGTPSKPTVTQASTNSPGFVVSYSKVSGATGYKIQWSTSSGFSGAKSLVTTATKKTITGLSQGKKYYVRVAAKKGSTYGKYSAATSRTRATNWVAKTWNVSPTLDPFSGKIVVRWNRPTSNTTDALYYRVTVADNRDMNSTDAAAPRTVYRKQVTTSKTSSTKPSLTISSGLPDSFTGIGAKFFFNFEVKNADGSWKPATNISKAATRYSNGLLPTDPEIDAVTSSPTCDGFVARWDDGKSPLNARGLQVRYWPTADPSADVVKTGYQPAESITVSGLSSGVEYTYQARAISGSQRSVTWTAEDTVTPLACSAGGAVRVGSYNITGDNLPDTYIPAWTSRRDKVKAIIASSGADLVGLQEARTSGGSTQLADLLVDDWAQADNGLAGTHLIYRSSYLTAVGSPEKRSLGPKGGQNAVAAVFSLVSDPETQFIGVNLHTDATDTPEGWADEVDAVWTDLIPSLKANNGIAADLPIILTGDYNLARSEYRDTFVRAAMGARASDAQYWQPGRTLETFNSTNKLKQCGHAAELGIDVDGIFSAFGAAPTSWSMVGIKDGDCMSSTPPSDHNMIVAGFELPDPTP